MDICRCLLLEFLVLECHLYDLSRLKEQYTVNALFNENNAVILQAKDDTTFEHAMADVQVVALKIGKTNDDNELTLNINADQYTLMLLKHRDDV